MVKGGGRLGKVPRLFALVDNGQRDRRPLLGGVALRQRVSQLSPPPLGVFHLCIALLHSLAPGGQLLFSDVGLLDHDCNPIEAGAMGDDRGAHRRIQRHPLLPMLPRFVAPQSFGPRA
jgi:hypothetical protein